jgi:hypothetical protein
MLQVITKLGLAGLISLTLVKVGVFMVLRVPGSDEGMGRIWAIIHIWLQKRLGLSGSEIDEHLSKRPPSNPDSRNKTLFGVEVPEALPVVLIVSILIGYLLWDQFPNWEVVYTSPLHIGLIAAMLCLIIWDWLPKKGGASKPDIISTPTLPALKQERAAIPKMAFSAERPIFNDLLNRSYDEMNGYQLVMFVMGCVSASLVSAFVLMTCWTGGVLEPPSLSRVFGLPASPVFLVTILSLFDVGFSTKKSTHRPRALRFALLDLTFTVSRPIALAVGYLTAIPPIRGQVTGVMLIVAFGAILDFLFDHVMSMFAREWYMPKPREVLP